MNPAPLPGIANPAPRRYTSLFDSNPPTHPYAPELMAITQERRTELIGEYRTNDSDTGSPQVQVSVLTERINNLTEHLRTHDHDFASRRGLLQMVSRRNRLLSYLKKNDRQAYLDLIGRLGLRK